MARVGFRPFRLTVRLSTPVALHQWPWLHLDAVVERLLLEDYYGEDYYRLPPWRVDPWRWLAEATGREPPRVPLARRADIYMASVARPEPWDGSYYLVELYKRADTGEIAVLARKRRRLSVASGPLRSWRIRLATIPARALVFEATGDPDRVAGLIRDACCLGAKRSLGFGRVREVEVEELGDCPHAGLVWCGTSQAARPLPIRLLASWEDAAVMAVRPPYWAPDNLEPAAPPYTRVALAGSPGGGQS